jgi:hypothetical protein
MRPTSDILDHKPLIDVYCQSPLTGDYDAI